MTEVAKITGVDKSFVSRVKSAEREFSIDHLELIGDHFGVEIGILLIDSAPPLQSTDPKRIKLREMCHEFIRKADALNARLKQKQKTDAA
jgi:transcriptional regulator with XRE-family HTH domain